MQGVKRVFLCREGAQRTLLAFRTLVCMVADCLTCRNAAALWILQSTDRIQTHQVPNSQERAGAVWIAR